MYNNDQVKENKGIQIVMKGDIKKQSDGDFLVRSQSNQDAWYDVIWERNHWSCNCMDYQKRGNKCKHVFAIRYFLILERIKFNAECSIEENHCPLCKQSTNVIKRGVRINRSGLLQRYYCKTCNRRFTGRPAGFEGMKNKVDIITTALDLYYRGLSLRQIVEHLETAYKVKVSHGTIYNWIKKYVKLVSNYIQGLSIGNSDRWHADETVLRVNGRHLLLWSLLDSKTRYLIATHISKKRGDDDASVLLRKGMKIVEEQPLEIVTDGLESYNNAIKKEIGTPPRKPVIHLQGTLSKGLNNKMERMNRTIKSRTNMMAGLNSEASTMTFAEGFKIYYNFIRPHMALGMTPAMMMGLATEKYDWVNLIHKSAKSKKHKREN